MLVPALVILAIFFGLPIIDLIRTSFTRWPGIGEPTYIGADNYVTAFTNPDVRDALLRSVALGVGAALILSTIATVLAALISGGIRGKSIYRVIWFLPAIAPPSAVAVFWALSVQPRSGAVNAFLGALGLGDTHAWLADPKTALYVIIAVAVWAGVGFAFLVILGAMEEVPVSVYEAASIDGASRVRQFFSITLPLVRPVLSMIVLLEVIWAFNGFTLVWGMTQGGPGNATSILPVQVYKDAFLFSNFGLAAAVSVVGGVLLLIVGLVDQSLGSRKGADE
ncbi:ABC-type sugar transport system permease subunit [Microbacterium foliorum]|uniref:carbohydrate ABC transporter permease n=1 Tax=Microbacterium foliorum TaxID=104336 RepID=UPI0020A0432C|nr:sugar ABC transporter permease [Microbacterium foliorum]MCP1428168.1 ABC-type sugar transport system permease subunit [Microbacterium foliorum]